MEAGQEVVERAWDSALLQRSCAGPEVMSALVVVCQLDTAVDFNVSRDCSVVFGHSTRQCCIRLYLAQPASWW